MKSQQRHVVIAGGGTGGHLFPGVAVIEAMQQIDPSLRVSFVGTEQGIEARVIPALGYDLHRLDVSSIKGNRGVELFRSVGRLPASGIQALKLLKKLKPDVVVSVGGYAAGPFTLAAAARGVATALMEQNAVPGMTNKLLGKVVDRAYLTFEQSLSFFPRAECLVTGNPVRQAILQRREDFSYVAPSQQGPFRILVIGGSGGAQSLNRDVPTLVKSLGENSNRIEVRHQAGRGRSPEVIKSYQDFQGEAEVFDFIDDMATAYAWCDLLICRAGASTIAEVLALGIPALYVPFPFAADNHQEKNALAIVEAGAGMMLRDEELTGDRAQRLVTGLVQNPVALKKMSIQARNLGRPEASSSIANSLFELIDSGR